MIKKIILNLFLMLLLSLIASIMLTILGRYTFKVISNSQTFFQYLGFYTVLSLSIQLITGFWLVYIFANYLLRKNVNKLLVSFISGVLTFSILKLITYLGFETYYFEPFKHFYQVAVFFIVGFSYPFLLKIFENLFKIKTVKE
jgi:hypothetical protein